MTASQTPTGAVSSGRLTSSIPRLALSISEACNALGVSHDHWCEHVAAHVRVVRLGRRKLVPVSELERFLADHAELVLPE